MLNKDSIVRTILDVYSEKTGIPVAFQYHNKIIWQTSKSFCSPYCQEMKKLCPEKCLNDHVKRATKKEKLTMCHAGLWNYILPIRKDEEIIGALLTGQRRLAGKDQESLEVITSFKNNSELLKQFYNTPIITDFNINLLKGLETAKKGLFEIFINSELERRKILNLAHEFLLPIQSIIANAENIYDELEEDDEDLKFQAAELIQQVYKLGMTAENMRSSTMGESEEKYRYKKDDILDVLIENVKIFKLEALRKNVDLKDPEILLRGEELPLIPMSRKNLTRAFFSLIHNAVKYSYFSIDENDSNRYIDIIVRNRNKYITIEISNYGIGILEEEIESGKIFEDGYRGILTTDEERTGSGIGLSEAKRIIEKHGGELTINSVLLGNNKYSGPYKTNVRVKLQKYR